MDKATHVAQVIDLLLEDLSDAKWHTLNEVNTFKSVRKLSVTKLRELLNFLSGHDFIEMQQSLRGEYRVIEVKLVPSVREFLKKIQEIEVGEQ